jgi:glycosyltransferase involved in cell wall biosynthesis
MKVLHIINSFEGGGAEKLTLQLHELSLKQGIDSHAVSLMKSSAGSLPNTHSLGLNSPYKLFAIIKLYLFLRQPQWKELDIIHVHLFPSQLFTPIITKLLGIKAYLITTEHSTSNSRRKIFIGKTIDTILYSFYVKVICISSGTFNALSNWQPKAVNKLITIYNGINISDFSNSSKVEQLLSPLVIVSVGRLVEAKNYEIAIRSLSKIVDQDFEYWIIGSGHLESHLKNLVISLKLDHKVKFLGFRKDIPDILHQADIFLQTSIWEGFGLAVVEAMASGLPVVVSDVPGVREVVTNESGAGFFINPLSEDDIANKLSQLINNPNLRLKMGQNAQIQSAKFDIHQTVQEYLDLYCSVCDSENKSPLKKSYV